MANASGDLMSHSFFIMGIIVICIYLVAVLGQMAFHRFRQMIKGASALQQSRIEKIMRELDREEEEDRLRRGTEHDGQPHQTGQADQKLQTGETVHPAENIGFRQDP